MNLVKSVKLADTVRVTGLLLPVITRDRTALLLHRGIRTLSSVGPKLSERWFGVNA